MCYFISYCSAGTSKPEPTKSACANQECGGVRIVCLYINGRRLWVHLNMCVDASVHVGKHMCLHKLLRSKHARNSYTHYSIHTTQHQEHARHTSVFLAAAKASCLPWSPWAQAITCKEAATRSIRARSQQHAASEHTTQQVKFREQRRCLHSTAGSRRPHKCISCLQEGLCKHIT